MKKFKLETPCMIKNLKDHKNIRDTLISLIKDTKADYLESNHVYLFYYIVETKYYLY